MTDKNKGNGNGTRETALAALVRILEKGEMSHIVLKEELDKCQNMERRDRAFITRLCEGCIEHLYELDYIIDAFSKTKVKKMKPVIRCIMRMAVYQMKYMESVPDSAACNEAVRLATKKGFSGLKGFVNGVLRNIARGMDTIIWPDPEKEPMEWMRVHYSVPEWIIEALLSSYGREKTEAILAGGLEERPLTVRMNRSRQEEAKTLETLHEAGVEATPVEGIPGGYVLRGYENPASLPAFAEGYMQIQDISSMLAGLAAAPKENQFVLDVCAAPGGKSIHAADLLNGTGRVEAHDLTEQKVKLILDNADRCQMKNLTAKVFDALQYDEALEEKADVVIADLPCSGMGIIGRKSDIKYKLTKDMQKDLAMLQRQILDVVWKYVKPGGRLVFSTCTIFPSENKENANWFAENHPFEKEALADRIPERFLASCEDPSMMQLLPGNGETDGFFIASFRRTE